MGHGRGGAGLEQRPTCLPASPPFLDANPPPQSAQADKLNGGLDGIFQLVSCYNGKPMYRRKGSPAGEERVLWYSSTFGDWDVSKGTDPNEAEILMYGGEMEHASVPLFVSSW